MFVKYILDFVLELIKIYEAKRLKQTTSNKHLNNKNINTNEVFALPIQSDFLECEALKKWGCYFLSLIFISNLIKRKKYNKVKQFDIEELILLFKGFKENNIIKKNAFIINPNGLLKELGINNLIKFVDRKEEVKKYSNNNILITQYDYINYSHFVVCDFKNKVVFDSLGNSLVRMRGEPISVRRFEILDKTLAIDINKSLSYINI